jgi:hypothetical protein
MTIAAIVARLFEVTLLSPSGEPQLFATPARHLFPALL